MARGRLKRSGSDTPNGRNADIVVFEILRDSACAECGTELGSGRWLRMENERPLCMSCADLAHLVFLPTGDAALTRRASRYSRLRAVLVRFSRARKRYGRQGILVEESALVRAERECLADKEVRARARERRAEREARIDQEFRIEFAHHVRLRYPGCPDTDATAIAEHACLKHSGRVGRTSAAREFAPEAIDLAVRAHVRHVHTGYDELLGAGWEREEARSAVASETETVLERWRYG